MSEERRRRTDREQEQGMLKRIPSRRLVVLAVIVAAVIVVVAVSVSSCVSERAKEAGRASQESYDKQSVYVEGEINLPSSLSPQLASTLKEMALEDSDVDWIIRHTEVFAEQGDTVLKMVLKLTAYEPAAKSFVRNFADRYPEEEGAAYTDRVKKGTVPALYMWDERWGYTEYCSTAFGLTGSAPTALSMVYMGLTGNSDKTPYDMGQLAQSLDCMETFTGTKDEFFPEAGAELGLSVQARPATEERLDEALARGSVLIAKVGAGDFTEKTSYIVITGTDKQGKLKICDPYSAVNSAKTWDKEDILDQTTSLWEFSAQ